MMSVRVTIQAARTVAAMIVKNQNVRSPPSPILAAGPDFGVDAEPDPPALAGGRRDGVNQGKIVRARGDDHTPERPYNRSTAATIIRIERGPSMAQIIPRPNMIPKLRAGPHGRTNVTHPLRTRRPIP